MANYNFVKYAAVFPFCEEFSTMTREDSTSSNYLLLLKSICTLVWWLRILLYQGSPAIFTLRISSKELTFDWKKEAWKCAVLPDIDCSWRFCSVCGFITDTVRMLGIPTDLKWNIITSFYMYTEIQKESKIKSLP